MYFVKDKYNIPMTVTEPANIYRYKAKLNKKCRMCNGNGVSISVLMTSIFSYRLFIWCKGCCAFIVHKNDSNVLQIQTIIKEAIAYKVWV